jgi:phosphohistidine phosphatase
MKQLFIVRHAKAEAGAPDQSDFDRALTEKGRNDAFALGLFLKEQNLWPQKALVSTARRTRETFAQMKLSLGDKTSEEFCDKIYNAAFEDLCSQIFSTSDSIESLMIVGHNPGVHALAVYFSKAGEEPQNFPPASLCILNFNASWKNFARRSGQGIADWRAQADKTRS